MARVGLAAYRLRMKERRGPEWWTFGRGTAQDAYEELDQYLRNRLRRLVRLGDPDDDGNYIDQRAILLTRIVRDEDRRMLAGLFLKGEAGTIRQIRDFDDPEGDPVYQTGLNEGILAPLYFRFHLQDGRRFGVALLQTLGIDGLKSYMATDLRRFFGSDAVDQRTVELVQLVDMHVLEAFATQGSLQDVVLVNSGQTTESRQAMQRNTVAGDTLGRDGDKLELRLARSGGFGVDIIRRLWNAIRNQQDPRELVNVQGLGPIDDLKVEITLGGRTQTFSLLNPDDSPIRLDISDDVAFGQDGFPSWQSLHAAADGAWTTITQILDGRAQ